jgi:hypothetical protein
MADCVGTGTAGCAWPVNYSAAGDCAALGSENDPSPDRAAYETMAADYLWNWTGRVYGLCPVAVRPCRGDCPQDDTFWGAGPFTTGSTAASNGGLWGPVLVAGNWFNLGCGVCGDDCSCGGTPALRLPSPVATVDRVLIDGAPLDPASYRVDNYALLVRTDGGAWPTCQNMNADPATDPGTFRIDYQYGRPVPVGGQLAAGILACELAKAAAGDKTCALPQRVQTIARQGVTMTMLDTFDDVEKGRTGIWLVDSWVASVTQPRRASRVYSVDISHPPIRVASWP